MNSPVCMVKNEGMLSWWWEGLGRGSTSSVTLRVTASPGRGSVRGRSYAFVGFPVGAICDRPPSCGLIQATGGRMISAPTMPRDGVPRRGPPACPSPIQPEPRGDTAQASRRPVAERRPLQHNLQPKGDSCKRAVTPSVSRRSSLQPQTYKVSLRAHEMGTVWGPGAQPLVAEGLPLHSP